MPTNISVGETVHLNARFLNYNDSTDDEDLVVPDSVDGFIYKYNSGTSSYDPFDVFAPTESETGLFEYDWLTTEEGKFQIDFVGTFDTDEVINRRFLFVGAITTTDTLDANSVTYYLGVLDPLFLDPEIVLKYFPDGDLVEITELIYWYSKEVLYIMDVTSLEDDEITPLIQEFVLASVLCDLSRIYTFSGGMSGFSSSDSFTLGDLQVKSGSGNSSSSSGSGTGGATTWCELAAILKGQLVGGSAGMKAIVKGSNFCNPIPCRQIRRID